MVRAGVAVAATWSTACLDRNPWFEEPPLPTGSGSGEATTQVEPVTSGVLPTTTSGATPGPGTTTEQADTEATGPSTTTTTSTSSTGMTFVMEVCGDGIVDGGEECDEGADNADDGACTTTCAAAKCGDALMQAGVEACDDGNALADDGCIDCKVPRTCLDVHDWAPNATSGAYLLDLDGGDPAPPLLLYCDMLTAGGGWTVVERSPRQQPIGAPLFADTPVNTDQPGAMRFRAAKATIEQLIPQTVDMRIDCGGADYLLTDAAAILLGDDMPCSYLPVVYKEAQLKGYFHTDLELCTGFHGPADDCQGAWNVDEYSQGMCYMPPYPWKDMVPVTSDGADVFAVDASVFDNLQGPPPIHDCHQPDAVRAVMLR
ncbi:fibrinogen-like YCDxxxxGGGW domain-containing protein [Nannocystis punicea]|uniref:Fibrinogen-like YCDxxxxGGGW domain-containing protein n=1 Tax=Nannocystis punicea TaxID=2995304 RepID=A0ABY7HES8_9BACT|nr:fibrinogen-like YCDxxxxGGGW domain-containing protein [Nannocystis poenicansa]WAS97793.1 fibrinogen-like YCDxxxxGGGW domain-containing protein [Nannocystis poenicansa]